jgi:hypothetical protein
MTGPARHPSVTPVTQAPARPQAEFRETTAENDRLHHELLELRGEPCLVAYQRVRQLVHQHRHPAVRREPRGDADPARAVIAQPLDALELGIRDGVAELARERLERGQQGAVRVALDRGARRRQWYGVAARQRVGLRHVEHVNGPEADPLLGALLAVLVAALDPDRSQDRQAALAFADTAAQLQPRLEASHARRGEATLAGLLGDQQRVVKAITVKRRAGRAASAASPRSTAVRAPPARAARDRVGGAARAPRCSAFASLVPSGPPMEIWPRPTRALCRPHRAPRGATLRRPVTRGEPCHAIRADTDEPPMQSNWYPRSI